MSNFKQNTVETVGDAALAESIINRSITELQDNITTSIAAQKFRGCSALANVIFPSVTSVGIGAFWQCTALAKADFEVCVSFAQNAFYGCSALAALILRCTDAVCTLTGNLSGTPIATGAGYIYVPLALVDTYKAATGWSTYADQIRAIEDYPSVCGVYTWEGVFAKIDDGSYADVYEVGDVIPLDLGSEGLVNMRVAAIDRDVLADGSGYAPITWISNEVLMTDYHMNPSLVTNDDGTYQEGTGTIGGWPMCEMRTYLQEIIKPLLPSSLQEGIKSVTKHSLGIETDGTTQTTFSSEETLWIPSMREIRGSGYGENSGVDYYDTYFKPGTWGQKYKPGSSVSVSWWIRSSSSYASSFYRISDNQFYTGQTSDKYGVLLCFCT